ncbi:hypothetical protein MRB53_031375 [Persea americana]|uniref:Uncharacterized protein n=1 Tax=Persea americana TaxID=3435 RepID=A0ACC2KNZ5_PERAE|nr:hypothetical protein MRB53_031375 [Persea americana]
MADIRGLKSNQQLTQQLQSLESLFASLNPPSTFHNGSQFNPNLPIQRGRMYEAYAALRESKLLQKKAQTDPKTPPKKKVSFLNGPLSTRTDLAVARSVPDLSAALRKENKKPNSSLLQPNSTSEATPPSMRDSKGLLRGGSKSASVGEKKSVVRKSCVSLKELKGLSAAAASAIDEEGRGGLRYSKGIKKIALGHRQYG